MPRATVNIADSTRVELETCPEGFVELVRLSYGQYLQRQEMAMDVTSTVNRKSQSAEMTMDMAQRKVTEFEFRHCIKDHNLEDDSGNLLDFKNAAHVHLLDPKIGQEIAEHIDAMNQFESEGNS